MKRKLFVVICIFGLVGICLLAGVPAMLDQATITSLDGVVFAEQKTADYGIFIQCETTVTLDVLKSGTSGRTLRQNKFKMTLGDPIKQTWTRSIPGKCTSEWSYKPAPPAASASAISVSTIMLYFLLGIVIVVIVINAARGKFPIPVGN